MTTRKEVQRQKEREENITWRLDSNTQLLHDLSERAGVSTEILGNATYHTSLIIDEPVLQILSTVRTFFVWVEKIVELEEQKKQRRTEEGQGESEREGQPPLFPSS